MVDNASIHVCKGEVVGIAGLMGAGRTELAMSVFGKAYGADIRGNLVKDGVPLDLHNIRAAIRHKIAYITEDRKGDGLVHQAQSLTSTLRQGPPGSAACRSVPIG